MKAIPLRVINWLFLISGGAAIIYQVIWQRVLYSVVGVNTESVTIIISVFMLGLGVGSLVGGMLSKKFSNYLPFLFFAIEIAIGLFGLASLPLIYLVGNYAIGLPTSALPLIVYAILAIPTMAMGATLPILVQYLFQEYGSVGRSVSSLYFVNTIGSAAAAFLIVFVLFAFMDISEIVVLAVGLNFAIGGSLYVLSLRARTNENRDDASSAKPQNTNAERGVDKKSKRSDGLSLPITLGLSCVVGFISLSLEILVFSTLTFTWIKAGVFAITLGCVLVGIALGAYYGFNWCTRKNWNLTSFISIVLFLSGVSILLFLPISGELLTYNKAGFALVLVMAVVIFAPMGSIFPLLCHLGIRSKGKETGQYTSWIYGANIVGATTGPILTGFYLMNIWSLEELFIGFSIATFSTGILVAGLIPSSRRKLQFAATGIALISLPLFFGTQISEGALEKLYFKTEYNPSKKFTHIVHTRTGIISTYEVVFGGEKKQVLLGNGGYDGHFNVDPINNVNAVTRAYFISSLHPNPTDVLVIGLASGSWAAVISENPRIENMTVVEINAGYLEMIKTVGINLNLLENPKVTIEIDDGRRWLKRNPDSKFDLIVVNNPLHYRPNTTNLLSTELFEEIARHLKPGGLYFGNITGAQAILRTGAEVFPYVSIFGGAMIAGERQPATTGKEMYERLLATVVDGEKVFARSPAKAEIIASKDWSNKSEAYKILPYPVITDDNMYPEYKRRSLLRNVAAIIGLME